MSTRKSLVRTNLFNYNPSYAGPRFYAFSTWSDDITQNYLTASSLHDHVIHPSHFIALKITQPIGTVINSLEQYFENKLAWIRDNYFINENADVSPEVAREHYAPLLYLFEALGLYEKLVEDGENYSDSDYVCKRMIIEDIVEQNYNGAFVDILCTVPQGVSLRKIASLLPERFLQEDTDTPTGEKLVGWENLVVQRGQVIAPKFDEGTQYHFISQDYKENGVEKTIDSWTESQLETQYSVKFINDTSYDDTSFEYNVIIPIYKVTSDFTQFDIDGNVVSNTNMSDTEFTFDCREYIPLGIWFNLPDTDGTAKCISVETDKANTKYSASWTLSISAQIKPYYATNSVPVRYDEAKDIASTMNTFSGVLKKIHEMQYSVNQLTNQVASIQKADSSQDTDLTRAVTLKEYQQLKQQVELYDQKVGELLKTDTYGNSKLDYLLNALHWADESCSTNWETPAN